MPQCLYCDREGTRTVTVRPPMVRKTATGQLVTRSPLIIHICDYCAATHTRTNVLRREAKFKAWERWWEHRQGKLL